MRRSNLFAILILLVLPCTAWLWASTRARNKVLAAVEAAAGKPAPPAAAEGEAVGSDRPRSIRVRPGLRDAFEALGDRLVKPGRERVLLAAHLSLRGEEAGPVYLIREFPDLLRLEERAGGTGRVRALVFGGAGARRNDGDVTSADEELIETLVHDSPEHFFQGQVSGAATRFLGAGYRPDESESFEHDGPTYDVYEVTGPVVITGEGRQQVKRYYFNSATRLLEWVKYETDRGGAPARVTVQLGGWQEVQGQRVAGHVVRRVDGETVIDLRVTSAGFAPRAQDGAFDLPRN